MHQYYQYKFPKNENLPMSNKATSTAQSLFFLKLIVIIVIETFSVSSLRKRFRNHRLNSWIHRREQFQQLWKRTNFSRWTLINLFFSVHFTASCNNFCWIPRKTLDSHAACIPIVCESKFVLKKKIKKMPREGFLYAITIYFFLAERFFSLKRDFYLQ